jgi:hypothetical protein
MAYQVDRDSRSLQLTLGLEFDKHADAQRHGRGMRDRSRFELPTPTSGARNTDSEPAGPEAVLLNRSDSEPSSRGEDRDKIIGQPMPPSRGEHTGDLRTRQRRRRRGGLHRDRQGRIHNLGLRRRERHSLCCGRTVDVFRLMLDLGP